MRSLLLILSIGLLHISASSQNPEFRYDNITYDPLVESVILSLNGEVYNPVAIVGLGSLNSLKLSFDRLKADNEFYQYSITHCTANWEESNLQKTEYLEGDLMGELRDFKFSTNTFKQYVNYTLIFPEENMKITKSGNYLIKIFRNFDEEDLVLTRRFMVIQNKVKVTSDIHSAMNPKYRFSKQEVDFEVDHENVNIQNPMQNIQAVVMQNNSWTNSISNLKPLFINGNRLLFNYEDENLFDGTHEFRSFDIRSLRFFSRNVAEKFTDSLVNVVLLKDELRSHLSYSTQIDFNGQRVIQNEDGSGVWEDADYALVHFYLEAPNKINMGDVYVYGEFTDWRIQPKYKMTYLDERGGYYCKALLKQSYYNYHYVVAKETSTKPSYLYTEGNHFETENDYTILIYHTNLFYGYDELIGMTSTNTGNIRR